MDATDMPRTVIEALQILDDPEDESRHDWAIEYLLSNGPLTAEVIREIRSLLPTLQRYSSASKYAFGLLAAHDSSGAELMRGMTEALDSEAEDAWLWSVMQSDLLPDELSDTFCQAFLAAMPPKKSLGFAWLYPRKTLKLISRCRLTLRGN